MIGGLLGLGGAAVIYLSAYFMNFRQRVVSDPAFEGSWLGRLYSPVVSMDGYVQERLRVIKLSEKIEGKWAAKGIRVTFYTMELEIRRGMVTVTSNQSPRNTMMGGGEFLIVADAKGRLSYTTAMNHKNPLWGYEDENGEVNQLMIQGQAHWQSIHFIQPRLMLECAQAITHN